jgi:hypothetical protein
MSTESKKYIARRVFGILQKEVVLQEKGLGSRIDN